MRWSTGLPVDVTLTGAAILFAKSWRPRPELKTGVNGFAVANLAFRQVFDADLLFHKPAKSTWKHSENRLPSTVK